EPLHLFPLPSTMSASMRKALYPSGSKDDPRDADLLLDLLLQHRDKLHRLSPDTEALRMLKLGFRVSEPTVSRWLRQAPRNPDSTQRRLTFLRNHRDAIAAMDFFLVPTFTFGVLYCFFVMGHDRRRILRFNVTRNSNALWIVQQMREAWPYTPAHRFLLFDRDAKFGNDVVSFAEGMGSERVRTAFRSPWQNGVAFPECAPVPRFPASPSP